MPNNRFVKAATSVLDYKFDWSDWLDAGETISSKTVTVPTGLTKNSDALADTNTAVLVWLSGGTTGERYTVSCQIVTSAGRTDARYIEIEIGERPA